MLCPTSLTLKAAALLVRMRRRLGYAASRVLAVSACLGHHHRAVQDRRKNPRRFWVRPIFQSHDEHGAWASLIPLMKAHDREKFYNFFRMWPEDFDILADLTRPFLQKKSQRKPISPDERLAITLRKFASGDSNASLSYLFLVSDQVISNILLETSQVLFRVLQRSYMPKPTMETWLQIAAEYQSMWDLPHCLGAADGVHIVVKCFARCGSRCFNYKKTHSISVLVVADAKQRFILAETGASGSRGDGGIYATSQMAKKLASGALNIPPPCPVDGMDGDLPFFFIGDCAYPRGPNFQHTIKGRFLDPEEDMFNLRLSRARRSVENALGIAQKRSELLRGPIEGSEPFVKAATLACIALHNFHLTREVTIPPNRRKYRPQGFADYINHEGQYVYGRWRMEKPLQEKRTNIRLLSQLVQVGLKPPKPDESQDGYVVQEKLKHFFIDNPVPWQWHKLGLLRRK